MPSEADDVKRTAELLLRGPFNDFVIEAIRNPDPSTCPVEREVARQKLLRAAFDGPIRLEA